MVAFGRALPRLRRRVEADLSTRGLTREKVLAAVVRVMEMTLIRIGNDEYARANKSFGLTTLRDRHVKFQGSTAVFEFTGKSGKTHRTGIRDRRRPCGRTWSRRAARAISDGICTACGPADRAPWPGYGRRGRR